MIFNNSQNNSRDNNETNTRGIQLKNKNGFDPSTLLLGFWGELISIKIHPALEKNKQTETKAFDYEKVVSTAITQEKATVLIEGIEKVILPAIEKGENKSVGVPVGGDSLVVVGTGVKLTGSVRPYIAIHKALDEKTKKPEMSIHYEFVRSNAINDYDEETGSFKKSDEIHSELLVFLDWLKSAKIGLSNSVAHSMRVVNKFYNERIENAINEIGSKLGVSTSSGGYRGNYSKKKDVFSSSNEFDSNTDVNSMSSSSLNMETLNNIDEINDFLN